MNASDKSFLCRFISAVLLFLVLCWLASPRDGLGANIYHSGSWNPNAAIVISAINDWLKSRPAGAAHQQPVVRVRDDDRVAAAIAQSSSTLR